MPPRLLPAVGRQEGLGSRAHSCNEAAHRAPNWKFCKFKHGHPSVMFGAPESAIRAKSGQEPGDTR
jgi:hypothetical protein